MKPRVLGIGALAVGLATAAAGSAANLTYGVVEIRITQGGLSPVAVRVNAEHAVPVWINEDSNAHTLVFENGCSLTVPAGERASAPCRERLLKAGAHGYQLADTLNAEGVIAVDPNERRVTLRSSRTEARVGQTVTLGGKIFVQNIAFSPPYAQTVTLLRRDEGAAASCRSSGCCACPGAAPTTPGASPSVRKRPPPTWPASPTSLAASSGTTRKVGQSKSLSSPPGLR